jgi:hypothetical protein
MGAVRFGVNSEWAEPRVLQVQFQGISGHAVDQFQNGSRQIVVTPRNFTSGDVRFPCAEALSAEQGDSQNSKGLLMSNASEQSVRSAAITGAAPREMFVIR